MLKSCATWGFVVIATLCAGCSGDNSEKSTANSSTTTSQPSSSSATTTAAATATSSAAGTETTSSTTPAKPTASNGSNTASTKPQKTNSPDKPGSSSTFPKAFTGTSSSPKAKITIEGTTWSLKADCNDISVSTSKATQQGVSIDGVAVTKMACDDMSQEQKVLEWLEKGPATYSVDGKTLTITTKKGSVTFKSN